MTQAIALSDAQKTKDEIIELCQSVTLHGIEIGRRLLKAEEEKHWELLGEDEWEYLQDIGLSQRQANKLKDVVRLVLANPAAKEEDIQQIGTTKLVRLIGPARSGKLDEELWAKAVTLSDLDLRRELGHNIPKVNKDVVICPKCGTEIPIFRAEPKETVVLAPAVIPSPKKEKPSVPEITCASEPFKKQPQVQLGKAEARLFDNLVKMGLDEDESTRRIAKKLREAHGEKVYKLSDDVVAVGKSYSFFAAQLAGG